MVFLRSGLGDPEAGQWHPHFENMGGGIHVFDFECVGFEAPVV